MSKNQSHNDLLREALADAKAVKDVAIENAKIALKESFTPRIQRVISQKLAEEEEGEEDDFDVEDGEEPSDDIEDIDFGGADAEEEEAPVAEEEDFGGGEEELDFSDEEEEESPVAEEEDLDFGDEEGGEEDLDMGDEEEPVAEEDEMGMEDEEDVDFEEAVNQTIRELEGDMEDEEDLAMEMDDMEDEEGEPVEEVADSSDIGQSDNKQPSKNASDDSTPDPGKGDLYEGEEGEEEEEISIDEILRQISEIDGEEVSDGTPEDATPVNESLRKYANQQTKKLREAYVVIQKLRNEMKETNLLNAKLMFSQKLFTNYNLNEGTKAKIIDQFDLATNIREVKLVFTAFATQLREQKNASKLTSLKESASRSSSRPTRSTRPSKNNRVLDDGSDIRKRLMQLANVK